MVVLYWAAFNNIGQTWRDDFITRPIVKLYRVAEVDKVSVEVKVIDRAFNLLIDFEVLGLDRQISGRVLIFLVKLTGGLNLK